MRKLLRKSKIKNHPQALSLPKAERALDMLLKGWQQKDIAKELGVTTGAVSKSLHATLEESNRNRLEMADKAIHLEATRLDELMKRLLHEMNTDPEMDVRAAIEGIRKLIDTRADITGLKKIRVEGNMTFGDRRRQLERDGLPELNEEGDDV